MGSASQGIPWLDPEIVKIAWPDGIPIRIQKTTIPPGAIGGASGLLNLIAGSGYPLIAGIPNKIIIPFGCWLVMHHGTSIYLGGSTFTIQYENQVQLSVVNVGATNLLTNSGLVFQYIALTRVTGSINSAQTNGKGLFFGVTGADFTTGNGSLDVYVPYFLIDAV